MTTEYVITLISNPAQGKLAEQHLQTARDAARESGFIPAETTWLAPDEACDITIAVKDIVPNAKWAAILASQLGLIDVVVQPNGEYRRKKLLISDMDSTIITIECIDELADMAGIKPLVSAITERAMQGELDFKQALVERVRLLRGLPVEALAQVYEERLKFMPGAKELVATMRANGARTMLVSGGFTYFTSRVRDTLGFDSDSANLLDAADGKLTGEVVYPILDKDAKLQSLRGAVYQLKLQPEESLAIGDGANDLPMIEAAGLGVAYHAKPAVRAKAAACLNYADLTGALYAQGYRKSEFKKA